MSIGAGKSKSASHEDKKSIVRANLEENPAILETCLENQKTTDASIKLGDNNVVNSSTRSRKDTCKMSFAYDERRKAIKQLNTLKTHSRRDSEKPYSCDVCKLVFKNLGGLKRHSSTHTSERPYSCDVCKRTFKQLDYLKNHLRAHTGEKPYSCYTCKQDFRRLSHLKRHFRVHAREKPYPCYVCKQTFKNLGSLKVHSRKHSDKKSYSCHVCKQAFNKLCNLKTHSKIHDGEKPYSGDAFNVALNQLNSLKCYSIKDTRKEEPFLCYVCKQPFIRLGNLKNHLILHVCNKSFRRLSCLQNHSKKYSHGKPYTCDVCKQSFRQLIHLNKHLKKHTDEEFVIVNCNVDSALNAKIGVSTQDLKTEELLQLSMDDVRENLNVFATARFNQSRKQPLVELATTESTREMAKQRDSVNIASAQITHICTNANPAKIPNSQSSVSENKTYLENKRGNKNPRGSRHTALRTPQANVGARILVGPPDDKKLLLDKSVLANTKGNKVVTRTVNAIKRENNTNVGTETINPIKKENNTNTDIKAVENKKYFHIWRLPLHLTEDSLLKYVRKILGADSHVEVNKIKYNILQQEHSSFRICVSAGNFKALCNPSIWPKYAEYSERMFFS